MSVAFIPGTGGDVIQLSGPDLADSVPIVKNVSAYSISMWVRRDSDTGDSQQLHYIQAQQGNPNSRFETQFQASISLALRSFARAPDSGGAEIADSATIITEGVWTHTVVIADPGNDLIDFYINGVLDQSNSVAFTNSVFDNVDADEVFIGSGNAAGTTQNFDGLLADYRGYARRLTDAEIKHLFVTRGHDGIVPDFWWPMNQKGNGASVVAAEMAEIAPPNHFGNRQAHGLVGDPTYRSSELAFRRAIG